MAKKNELPDPSKMEPDELYRFEIARELGLDEKILAEGWGSLTSKESGRIGGIAGSRKRKAALNKTGEDCAK